MGCAFSGSVPFLYSSRFPVVQSREASYMQRSVCVAVSSGICPGALGCDNSYAKWLGSGRSEALSLVASLCNLIKCAVWLDVLCEGPLTVNFRMQ